MLGVSSSRPPDDLIQPEWQRAACTKCEWKAAFMRDESQLTARTTQCQICSALWRPPSCMATVRPPAPQSKPPMLIADLINECILDEHDRWQFKSHALQPIFMSRRAAVECDRHAPVGQRRVATLSEPLRRLVSDTSYSGQIADAPQRLAAELVRRLVP